MKRFRLDKTNWLAEKWRADGEDVVEYGDVHWVRDGEQYFGSTDSDSVEVEQFVGMQGCHVVHEHHDKPAPAPTGGSTEQPKKPGKSAGKGKSDSAPGHTGDAGKSGDAPGHTGELPDQSHGKGTPGGPQDPGKSGEEHGKATAPGQVKKEDD